MAIDAGASPRFPRASDVPLTVNRRFEFALGFELNVKIGMVTYAGGSTQVWRIGSESSRAPDGTFDRPWESFRNVCASRVSDGFGRCTRGETRWLELALKCCTGPQRHE